MIRYLLFDLDETLYPPSSGLMPAIGERMREYLERRYGFTPEDAQALQMRYYMQYGTTLRGLMTEQQVDPQDFLFFVHDLDLAAFLGPDPRLRVMLKDIPIERVIVTNGDAPHARRVLERLGIADLFSQIFDIVFMEFDCKPSRGAYDRVLAKLAVEGGECILIEDSARNLPSARELGIHTILLTRPAPPVPPNGTPTDPARAAHSNGVCPSDAEICIPDIYHVADAVGQLTGGPRRAANTP